MKLSSDFNENQAEGQQPNVSPFLPLDSLLFFIEEHLVCHIANLSVWRGVGVIDFQFVRLVLS